MLPTGNLAHNPGMCPDWELNQQPFGLQAGTQSTEPHQPLQDKERILKSAKEKQMVTYRGVPIRLSADFSKEILQAGRPWQEIFKIMKRRTYNQDCSTHQSYRLGQIKSSPDNRYLQNSHGDVKWSVGNGVGKELIHMSQGHEQWWEDFLRELGSAV